MKSSFKIKYVILDYLCERISNNYGHIIYITSRGLVQAILNKFTRGEKGSAKNLSRCLGVHVRNFFETLVDTGLVIVYSRSARGKVFAITEIPINGVDVKYSPILYKILKTLGEVNRKKNLEKYHYLLNIFTQLLTSFIHGEKTVDDLVNFLKMIEKEVKQ